MHVHLSADKSLGRARLTFPSPGSYMDGLAYGEVRLYDTKTGNHTNWRRIKAAAPTP